MMLNDDYGQRCSKQITQYKDWFIHANKLNWKKTTVGHITGRLFIHLFTTHKDEGEHFGSTLVAHAHTHTDTYIYFGTFSEKEHDTHTHIQVN